MEMATFHFLLLLITVFLRCFSSSPILSCSSKNFTVTIESFARQNRERRLLLVTENGNGEFGLSFTGRKGELGTEFIYRKQCSGQNIVFSLTPSKMPDFILIAEKGQLVVKNSSTVDPTDNNCKFQKRRITLKYSDGNKNSNKPEDYAALISLSTPRAVIKGSKSGKVFLDMRKWRRSWKDCHAWVKISSI